MSSPPFFSSPRYLSYSRNWSKTCCSRYTCLVWKLIDLLIVNHLLPLKNSSSSNSLVKRSSFEHLSTVASLYVHATNISDTEQNLCQLASNLSHRHSPEILKHCRSETSFTTYSRLFFERSGAAKVDSLRRVPRESVLFFLFFFFSFSSPDRAGDHEEEGQITRSRIAGGVGGWRRGPNEISR